MKYLMVDMDGTVNEYNINGSVILENWFERNIFIERKPVFPMINKIKEYHDKGWVVFILSVAPSDQAIYEKQEWLDRYMQFVKFRFFVGEHKRKIDYLNELTKDLDRSNVYVLDDTHTILEEAEQQGYNAVHISRFLCEKEL